MLTRRDFFLSVGAVAVSATLPPIPKAAGAPMAFSINTLTRECFLYPITISLPSVESVQKGVPFHIKRTGNQPLLLNPSGYEVREDSPGYYRIIPLAVEEYQK